MNISAASMRLAINYSYITEHKKYQELKGIKRHLSTDTYDHSIRVACLSAKISRMMGGNIDVTIRAALLHDFCLVDYHSDSVYRSQYLFFHPKEAVKNSIQFKLTKEEEKAILSHMFPFAKCPTSKAGWSITIADKLITLYELSYRLKLILLLLKSRWRLEHVGTE